MTDTTTEPREPDNPAAWALAQHIADHPVSTIQAAFRYLNAPLAIELREEPAAVLPAPADRAACQWPACMPEAQQQALTADVQREMRPPTDRAALRDRIADALERADYRPDMRRGDLADAVLAVLPTPTDQAAVLREAADRFDGMPEADASALRKGITWATSELRRLAAEEQPTTEAQQ